MSRDLKKLLTFNMGYAVIYNYINIFVNFYIWQERKSFADICLFNLVYFFICGIASLGGYKLLLHTSTRFNSLLSVFFAVFGFLVLMFYHPVDHFLLILAVGVPLGLFGSLFWTAGNISISLQGKAKDFGVYWSYSNTFTQIISVVNPLLSALFIYLFGFAGSFVVMTIFIGFMVVVSFTIPKIVVKHKVENENFFHRASYKSVFRSKKANFLFASMAIGIIYTQLQNIFSLLFTFQATNRTMVVALLSAGYALATIASFAAYRKIQLKENAWMMFALILNAIGIFFGLFHVAFLFIISNFLTTIGIFFFSTIWTAQQFAEATDFTLEERIRYFIWREMNLDITRSAFLGVLIVVPALHEHYTYLFLLVILLSSVFVFVDRKIGIEEEMIQTVDYTSPEVAVSDRL